MQMISIAPAQQKAVDASQIQLSTLPPLALYVHIPWCVRKCPYCDFNSHQAPADLPEERYLQALRADLEQALPLVWGRKVHTIFIGGGTPSLFSAGAMDRLLSELRALLPFSPDAEITLEANPGAIEAEKFLAFRASGINRLSLGIQSFHDQHLQALGRIHGGDEARRAVTIARQYFDRINLDLMFALPGQTEAQCLQDLEIALAFAPTHLSCYQLTLEANTLFAKYPPVLPDEDLAFAMQETIEARLAQAGFIHYEVSAYAQPGQACRHNLNYWKFGDYLGIGAGAHGKISFADRIVRQVKQRHPQTYMQLALEGRAVQSELTIPSEELPFEFMLNAMRLHEGVALACFTQRTGLALTNLLPKLELAKNKGLLEADFSTIRPTPLGRRFLNDLQSIFLVN
jgi:putative oxygen-independent coproporphyrinogen III oxidase